MIESLRVRILAGAAGEFSSPVNFVCRILFGVRSTPRVTAVARKRPQSFLPKCRLLVTPKYAYTLDLTKSEWDDYAAIQA